MSGLIKPHDFHNCVRKLRNFFLSKGFIEVHPQSAQSILAACEDPKTISTYRYGPVVPQQHTDGMCTPRYPAPTIWPLPQTGQMWLEHVLLDNPDINGCFAVTTSYRNEPNPIEGRHETIFPMFEFESKGTMDDLLTMEKSLLTSLGFGHREHEQYDKLIDRMNGMKGLRPGEYQFEDSHIFYSKTFSGDENYRRNIAKQLEKLKKGIAHFPDGDYQDIANRFGVKDIEHAEEQRLCEEEGPVFFLKNFPLHTSPFWNMKMEGDISKKVDVILHGQETIGSAERSCDRDQMREMFETISDGEYANILYDKFTRERVNREFEEFMDKDFFPRYGGGIGVTRMIRAMKMSNLLEA